MHVVSQARPGSEKRKLEDSEALLSAVKTPAQKRQVIGDDEVMFFRAMSSAMAV
jgi:hypothetical protein